MRANFLSSPKAAQPLQRGRERNTTKQKPLLRRKMVAKMVTLGGLALIGGSEEDNRSLEQKENTDCESLATSEDESGDDSSETSESSRCSSHSEDEQLDPTEEVLPGTPTKTGQEEAKDSHPLQHGTEGLYIKPSCEHCRIEENQKHERVTPRNISKGQFLLMLEDEGSYQCTVTGLIFEVSQKAHIKYSVLSWNKYSEDLKTPWIVAGPIFDVNCGPAILKSIHFPHSLCLGDHLSNVKTGVLHIKNGSPVIEPSSDLSATHVKWNVSSLSPVGPVIQTSEPIQHHGVVLLYKVINNYPSLSFSVYVAANNDSVIKDISKAQKQSKKKFIKIDKPPACQKSLQAGRKYRLISEPEAEINPQEIEFFDQSSLKLKNYIEVYFEQPVEFKLSLKEVLSDENVWTAKLRPCDWIYENQNEEEKKSKNVNRKRKSTSSISEEDDWTKKQHWNDTTGNAFE
nr:PREDICTED: NACHT, LRR and PYD domains-containing protein 1-like [Latimeria chalumnae]|eukprot:XP_006002130.1 PREDICTED: NACHT, LRR and PYD domains-containing protein 1-like [Latimeria chalumnae]